MVRVYVTWVRVGVGLHLMHRTYRASGIRAIGPLSDYWTPIGLLGGV